MLPANRYETDVVRWKTARMRLVTASGSPYGFRAEASSWNSSKKRISCFPSATATRSGSSSARSSARSGSWAARPGRQCELDPLPQLADHLQHGARLRRGQRRAARAARAPKRAVRRGAVGDHGGREASASSPASETRNRSSSRRVGAPARGPARAPPRTRSSCRCGEARHDEVGAGLEPRGDLREVVAASDQLSGRDRRIRREQVPARSRGVALAHCEDSLHSNLCKDSHRLCKAVRG